MSDNGVFSFGDVDMSTLVDDMPVSVPDDDSDGPTCQTCGEALTYSGRGRKPKYCDAHKPGRAASTGTRAPKVNQKARDAAAVLGQFNGLVAIGLSIAPGAFNLPHTASAIAGANEAFEEAAAKALAADPKLADMILKTGAASGKASLIIAYGMLAGAVAPVAIMEFKSNKSREADSEDRASSD